MIRAFVAFIAFIALPGILAAGDSWSAKHNFQWWHVPLPGYESRIHPERRA